MCGRASTSTIILGVTLVAQPHLYLEKLCREIKAVKAENVQLRATIDQIRSDVTVLEITGVLSSKSLIRYSRAP